MHKHKLTKKQQILTKVRAESMGMETDRFRYQVNFDGVCTDATNLSVTPNADLVPIDLNANAVLVHLMPLMDAEGNVEIKRLYTISCVTDDMKDLLLKEVERIKMGNQCVDWLDRNWT